jgi:hydroxymethylglutaryl-CoA lyase
MSLPKSITIVEVGPREGFQFEGIGQPQKIATADKIRLIEMLADTGVKTIQMSSFVSPKQVPQMADAEEICEKVTPRPGVRYTGIYLNDTGLKRAIATGKLAINGKITLTASETFSLRNQRRSAVDDAAMQRKIAALYKENGYQVVTGSVMAAFGCNYEGPVPIAKVIGLVAELHQIAEEVGSTLKTVMLADTMGWADPELVRRLVGAVRERWPSVRVGLHLHDTRGLAIANTMAGMQEGVDLFDTAVAGLGGCPFAGHKGAAGNVCSEEVVFLCERVGVETGIDLAKLVECARFAEKIVGHPLPSKLINASLECRMPEAAAA